MKRIALIVVSAFALGLPAATPAGPATKKLSKARADTAIEKKVRRVYRNKLDGRMVLSDCSRLSAKKFDCIYDVFAELQDQIEDERSGSDSIGPDGVLWTGTGSVKLKASGGLQVRVAMPR